MKSRDAYDGKSREGYGVYRSCEVAGLDVQDAGRVEGGEGKIKIFNKSSFTVRCFFIGHYLNFLLGFNEV